MREGTMWQPIVKALTKNPQVVVPVAIKIGEYFFQKNEQNNLQLQEDQRRRAEESARRAEDERRIALAKQQHAFILTVVRTVGVLIIVVLAFLWAVGKL